MGLSKLQKNGTRQRIDGFINEIEFTKYFYEHRIYVRKKTRCDNAVFMYIIFKT